MSKKKPIDYEKVNRLLLLRNAYETKGKTQEEVAVFLGVSRRALKYWLDGTSPANPERREQFIKLLVDFLAVDHQVFHQIWNEVMVNNWNWDPLTDDEIKHLNLEPPLALFLNVPARPLQYKIVGRNLLLATLKKHLIPGASLALTGMPGVGKTALVIELVRDREILARFPDGILWVKVGQYPDAMDELTKLAHGLRVNLTEFIKQTESARYRAVKNAIGQRHFLVVIDDVWHPEPAQSFLFDGPNCCHIMTSRQEHVIRTLRGRIQVERVTELEYAQENNLAYCLLNELAPEVCAAHPDETQKLVAKVGGLPLALVLLGGYLRTSVQSYFEEERKKEGQKALRQLEDARERLQRAQQRLGEHETKEQTLQEVIALSLKILPEDCAQAFYTLGAFAPKPAHFDRKAAEVVTNAHPYALRVLIDRNLLEIDGHEQLAIHHVLADVASMKTLAAAVERHQAFYLAIVNKDVENWQRIEQVYDQIKWAWEALPENEQLVAFVVALSTYQHRRGLWQDAMGWLNRGLLWSQAEHRQQDNSLFLMNQGHIYKNQGQWDEAKTRYEQSLAIAQELGDFDKVATILVSLGNILESQGQWHEAKKLYQQSMIIYRVLNDRHGEATILSNLGDICEHQGRWDEAQELYQQSLAIYQEVDDRHGKGGVLNNLAIVYKNQGRWDEARQLYEQTLAIAQELGDRHGEATILSNLGDNYKNQGQWDEAQELYQQSLAIYQEVDDRHGEATILSNLGDICEHQGWWDEARQLYERQLIIFRKLGDRRGEGIIFKNLGHIYKNQGQWDEAKIRYEQSLAILQELGDRQGLATILMNLGNVYISQGQWDEAKIRYEQSLAIYQELGDRPGEASLLDSLGIVYESRGQWDEARQMREQSLTIFRELENRYSEGITLTNLGIVYENQGQWEEAKKLYEQSLAILQELGDRQGVATILMNLANVYGRQGQWDEVKKCYEQSLAIYQELGDRQGEGMILVNWGIILERQGHQQRAIALWLEAITKLHPDSPEFKQVIRWLRAYYMAAKIKRFFKPVFILAILGVIVWGILAAFGVVSWPLAWLW